MLRQVIKEEVVKTKRVKEPAYKHSSENVVVDVTNDWGAYATARKRANKVFGKERTRGGYGYGFDTNSAFFVLNTTPEEVVAALGPEFVEKYQIDVRQDEALW